MRRLCLAKILSEREINSLRDFLTVLTCYNSPCMFRWFWLWFGLLVRVVRCRRGLLLENLALRQQLTVLKRKHPKPKLRVLDKLFWVAARRFWSEWKQSLIVVTPETVIRWHRAGFRLYWSFISKVLE